MILKKPTYDVESSQLLLETAAVAAAFFFPTARVPVSGSPELEPFVQMGHEGLRNLANAILPLFAVLYG